MQRLEVSGAVRAIYGSLGVKGLTQNKIVLVYRYTTGTISYNHQHPSIESNTK